MRLHMTFGRLPDFPATDCRALFRTISSALLAGLLAGLCLFLIQRSTILPLIHTAESYEEAAGVEAPSEDAFAREPIRSIATLLGDVFVATAFGLFLTAFYAGRSTRPSSTRQ